MAIGTGFLSISFDMYLHLDIDLSPEFVGLDMFVLKRALQALEKRGKAQLLVSETSIEEDGVKFFS